MMTKDIENRLDRIVSGVRYLLDTKALMYSSGDDGYDKMSRCYCFFLGSILEYKEIRITEHFVLNNDELEVIVNLADTIKGMM